MSGTILISAGNGRRTIIKLVLTMAVTAAAAYLLWPLAAPLLERVEMGPVWGFANMTALVRGLLVAVGVYVIFSLAGYLFEQLLPARGGAASVPWRVENGILTLGGSVVPLNDIRQVYCWPGRNILGQSTGNVVVNIETTGKNRLLRTLSGQQAEESASSLERLVRALGYGAAWDAAVQS